MLIDNTKKVIELCGLSDSDKSLMLYTVDEIIARDETKKTRSTDFSLAVNTRLAAIESAIINIFDKVKQIEESVNSLYESVQLVFLVPELHKKEDMQCEK